VSAPDRPRRAASLALYASIALTAGCGTGPAPTVDGGAGDAAPDTLEAGADAARNDAAPPDAGHLDAGAFDAGTDAGVTPECDPGAARVADCGMCGTQAEQCVDPGVWSPTSACLGQGQCNVGDVETRAAPRCASEQRICLGGCVWGAWEVTAPPGECEAGDTRQVLAGCPIGEAHNETCSSTCGWVSAPCVNACAGTPRTTPEWAREVCVPAGDFIRGTGTTLSYSGPAATVTLSAYYIDVYPVTNRRYRQCVTAGVCPLPVGVYARNGDAFLDFPAQGVSRANAIAFCAWDGSRRFPTGAQWEKAARGPSPRAVAWPWGDTIDCSIINGNWRPARMPGVICDSTLPYDVGLDPYDAFGPGTASYYGVQMMGFGVSEWVEDAYAFDWYTDPASLLPDPVCRRFDSDRPGWFEIRGGTRTFLLQTFQRMSSPGAPTGDYINGFRCVRTP